MKISNKQKLRVLDMSIEKWQNIVCEYGYDHARNDCACCLFLGCGNCPIARFAGDGCNFYEYREWVKYATQKDESSYMCSADDKKSQDLANHMLSRLYSVRREFITKIIMEE